jgi:hypothetical protein
MKLDFLHQYGVKYPELEPETDPYANREIDCMYYSMSTLSEMKNASISPIYLSVNIQSLNSKFEQLKYQITELLESNVMIDVIAIQETWEIRYPDTLCIPGFQELIYKNRLGMRGGGVGFYVRNGLNFSIIDELSPFENKIFESLTIKLEYQRRSAVILTCAYRSNGSIPGTTAAEQLERFNERFDELLHRISLKRMNAFVFMDSNIDLLNLGAESSTNFLDSILSKGFLQCITKATRIQNNSRSLIDNILTNRAGTVVSGTVVSDISDHFFTFIQTSSTFKKGNEKTVTLRHFTEHNLNNFKMALGGVNWNEVTNIHNVDQACDKFWSSYNELYNLIFPLKTVRFNKNVHSKQPFMSAGLLKSRATKNHLFHETISVGTPESKNRYKTYKQLYFKTVRAAKKLYFSNKLKQNAKNPKKTWQTLNEILDKGSSTETVEKIYINGVVETDPKRIATQFNIFFTSAGQAISDSVLPVATKPEDFINYNREIPSLSLTNTTPAHLKKIIRSLASKFSCDVNGISTKMIKFIGDEICLPLSHIFNLSLESGIFPKCFKQCRVIPIFKSGNRLECDNYRPISLLSSISKILEKIVAEKLIYHLLSNDLLYNFQFGFLPKRTTEQNLLHIVNYVSEALNENKYCVGIFLDLKKAFDVCSHEILLKKLLKMGITGNAFTWFQSYLSGRSQCVDIASNFSDFIDLAISVIQGSTLGPLLFLCYINDFWSATSMFSVLFADDTTCLAKGAVLADLIIYVNSELRKMANWFRANKMAVNVSKTKYIIFRTQGKPIDPNVCGVVYNSTELGHPDDPSLMFPIQRIYNNGDETSFKLLGVHFDEYLSFDKHISHLCSKISKSLYCINRIKNFVDLDSLKKLYFAMVHSHIAYCINVYGSANQTNLEKLVLKQKQAIRIICRANYRDHTAPLFRQLKILPLDKLIIYYNVKFMHSFVHKKLPLSFHGIWRTNRERNPNRELRDADDLYVPAHRLELIKRLPICAFPTAWNSAPGQKTNPVQHLYLKQLKNLLLELLA